MYFSSGTLPDIEIALNLYADGMVSPLFPSTVGSFDYLTTCGKD
jgi:hypothetical protein